MIEKPSDGKYRKEKIKRDKGLNLLEFPDNYVVFDIETTGPDPYYDSIIEVAAIKFKNGKEISRFQELVNPQYNISSFITELTGITNEMLKDARHESEVLKDFYKFIEGSVVVGHNTHFDLNFVYDSLLKHHKLKFNNNFVDTVRLARRLITELGHHRLKDLAKYYGYDYQGGHRAEFDSELTANIFNNLRELAIDKYGSIQKFEVVSKKQLSKTGPQAKDFVGDESKHEVDNLLYGKICVITGTLEYFYRREAMQIIANIGGINADNVTKKTNYLILGNFDYNSALKGAKSAKLKKAEKYILEGQDLEILSENTFYDLISEIE